MFWGTLKQWLKLQRLGWRVSRQRAALLQRWPNLSLDDPITWTNDDPSCVELGESVHFGPFSEIVVLSRSIYSSVPGSLSIGSRTWIGASLNIRAAGGRIIIGSNCIIAHHVSLVASNHTVSSGATYNELGWDEKRTGITIGDNVWIGCGVTVLPGVVIGDNAVVGAGSIVTKNIPSGTVWVGNPARQIRVIK